jgi:hypothetical protein
MNVVVFRWSHGKSQPDRSKRADFPTPAVIGDIAEYRSPIDGKLISSRSQRREDLKANDCVEWEPGMGATKTSQQGRVSGKYSNPRFAKKHGLPLSEAGHENARKMKQEQK